MAKDVELDMRMDKSNPLTAKRALVMGVGQAIGVFPGLSRSGTTIATAIMGYWLDSIGSAQAYTDAATNVLAIFAQLLMVRRYREQWIWWLIIDILCVKMWFVAGNWSMVAMYIAWIANCIYGWYNWSKLNKQQEVMN